MGRLVFLKDVTAKVMAAAESQRAREMYELLADNTADLIVMCDNEARLLYASPSHETMLGYTSSELVGRPLTFPVHRDDVVRFTGLINDIFGKPGPDFFSGAFRLVHKDGRVFWFETVGRKLFDSAGQVKGAVFSARDITARKKTEESLAESEIRLRTIADSLPIIISHVDRNLRYQFANRLYEEMFGKKPGEAVGLHISEVLGEDLFLRIKPHIDETWTGRPVSYMENAITAGGEVRRFWVRNIPHFGDNGEVIGYFAMGEDITERIEAEEAVKESERKYRELIENIDQVVVQVDTDGVLTYVSPAVTKNYGYSPENLVGLPFSELIHSDDLSRIAREFEDVLNGRIVSSEYRCRNASGKYRWVHSVSKALYDGDRVIGMQGIFTDVTRQHQSEENLRESEERYRTLVEESFDAVFIHDGNEMVFTNRQAGEMLGYTPAELVGMTFKEFSTPESYEIMKPRAEARLRGDRVRTQYEVTLARRDGSTFEAEIRGRAITLGGRKLVQTWVRDISDKKRAEEAIRASEAKYRMLVQHAPTGIYELDLTDFHFISVNEVMCEYTGYTQEEFLKLTPYDLLIDESAEVVAEWRKRLETEQAPHTNMELKIRGKNGREFWVLTNSSYFFKGNRPVRATVIAHDISERKKAEEEAIRLATAIEHAAEEILITNTDGTIVYVNPAFEKLTGYSRDEVLGKHPRMLQSGRHSAVFYREMWETISSGKVWTGRFTNTKKDGNLIELEATISPIFDKQGKLTGYVSAQRDITEQINLETQLRQSQKMEALGTLAGGIAHDFNNILTIILGYTQMAEKRSGNVDVQDDLARINAASFRAMDLVKRILTFSRQTEQERRPVDLRDIIEETLKLLRPSLPSTIEISTSIQAGRATVLADPTQLHQILMNLCTNSFQAMGETGGSLEISLREIEIPEEDTSLGIQLSQGRYMLISVSDNGQGIEPRILDRIFDPYFTTKGHGEGTGLGLAMVHGIVKSHGGGVRAYSEPSFGTTFHVYLPTIVEEAETKVEIDINMPGGRESILFVDDEEALVNVGRDILESLGYRVEALTSSVDALESFKAAPHKYDLIITDQIMPKMTGLELTEEAKRLRHDVPIIICTGLATNINRLRAQDLGVSRYILKPFLVAKMARTIREVLDGK